jgi:hypothetical protein
MSWNRGRARGWSSSTISLAAQSESIAATSRATDGSDGTMTEPRPCPQRRPIHARGRKTALIIIEMHETSCCPVALARVSENGTLVADLVAILPTLHSGRRPHRRRADRRGNHRECSRRQCTEQLRRRRVGSRRIPLLHRARDVAWAANPQVALGYLYFRLVGVVYHLMQARRPVEVGEPNIVAGH